MNKIKLLNINIDNISLQELLEKTTTEKLFIVTPNVDHFVKIIKDSDFRKIYFVADYVICDSKIIQYATKFLGTPIQEKISGSDFFPAFYHYHQNNEDIKIFLLGGQNGVANQAKFNINQKVQREIVVDAFSPSFNFDKNEQECQDIVKKINDSQANVLVIGIGCPKQEKWVLKYRHLLPQVRIFLPLGATIDFEAGNITRSPKWMSNIGLEWLYRLMVEPKRLWKRYLVDSIPFFINVFKYRFNNYNQDPLRQLQSLPIGQLLLEAGLLSSQQLDSLLQTQKQRNYNIKLGELAIELKFLSPETVIFFAEILPKIIAEKQVLSLEEYLFKAHLVSAKFPQEYQKISQQSLNWFKNLSDILKN